MTYGNGVNKDTEYVRQKRNWSTMKKDTRACVLC